MTLIVRLTCNVQNAFKYNDMNSATYLKNSFNVQVGHFIGLILNHGHFCVNSFNFLGFLTPQKHHTSNFSIDPYPPLFKRGG